MHDAYTKSAIYLHDNDLDARFITRFETVPSLNPSILNVLPFVFSPFTRAHPHSKLCWNNILRAYQRKLACDLFRQMHKRNKRCVCQWCSAASFIGGRFVINVRLSKHFVYYIHYSMAFFSLSLYFFRLHVLSCWKVLPVLKQQAAWRETHFTNTRSSLIRPTLLLNQKRKIFNRTAVDVFRSLSPPLIRANKTKIHTNPSLTSASSSKLNKVIA